MQQRAAIYIRTSSEAQGEGASPVEQENDCRLLANEKGLVAVHVYRDIEKYRVKNKFVEPTGLRSDRPALLSMLQDTPKGNFDVILAWREDRLYRGLRSMLMVLEVVQRYKITILLAKETFDPKIAPIRAWAAQMELESMQERMAMGVIARLKAGKSNTGQDRYGYIRVGEKIHIMEEEAKWVRQIFAWYIQKISIMQIRKRLIDANAPQKGGSIPRRIRWSRSSIQAILEAAKEYTCGFKTYSRAGQTFHIPVAPIIDMPIYELFVKMREENKTHPKHRKKNNYLLSGHLKCACNLTWRARTAAYRRSRKGEWVERKTPISTYFCPQPHKELRSPDCPKSVNAKNAEAQIWEKLYDFVMNPDFLLAQAKELVHQLQQNYEYLTQVQKELLTELEKQSVKRQQIITDARKARKDDDDFSELMRGLYGKEERLKHKLATIEQELKTYTELDWERKVIDYVAELQAAMKELNNANSHSPEEQHRVFLLKKQLVDELLAKATIDGERHIQVEFRVKIIDLAVSKEILNFPNGREIVARL
ncbi:MAG: recombinase family protein [Anaerolineae bacterium]|nr:recombinase family protein [Anaerolineae bacterium]MBT5466679.1 recombinase family protein [Candidatus Neomarinimicrobiota bacterium]MBT3712705.1 recombinase family protein [Anaerolineae bacterium]MBT4311604.1 recombinase family protein [Anaerolineae bacterium]MBT4457806.1 recombinase family protein [Anaerolineae bacterium]